MLRTWTLHRLGLPGLRHVSPLASVWWSDHACNQVTLSLNVTCSGAVLVWWQACDGWWDGCLSQIDSWNGNWLWDLGERNRVNVRDGKEWTGEQLYIHTHITQHLDRGWSLSYFRLPTGDAVRMVEFSPVRLHVSGMLFVQTSWWRNGSRWFLLLSP